MTDRPLHALLISTYEMGRQSFSVASAAAWLEEAGASVRCLDLATQDFSEDLVRDADLIAFHVPMHTATRLAVPAARRVRTVNPDVHVCFFGLYAPVNEHFLRAAGGSTVLGGEFEAGLAALARRLATHSPDREAGPQSEPVVSLDRQHFRIPRRDSMPPLDQHAHVLLPDGSHRVSGYVEATRGCKHSCRHCPVVPVYQGKLRVVQPKIVLQDVRQQVAAGARHITFGDPDFLNGPGHTLPIVEALHQEFPRVSYDVTAKVEHLVARPDHVRKLKDTGCLFVTTAVESFDPAILRYFDKGHTVEDVRHVVETFRQVGLALLPTFVPFTPWTTLDGYRSFLRHVAELGLVPGVAPVQYAVRLLVPPGSLLLDLPGMARHLGPLDEPNLSYTWHNPDPRVDDLQRAIETVARQFSSADASRTDAFREIWKRAWTTDGTSPPPSPFLPANTPPVPSMTEPWFC